MKARLRGYLVLAYVAISMFVLFLISLPPMIFTDRGDFSIWLARRVWSPSVLWLAGVRLELERLKPLPEGPAIYVSNHESVLDIFALFIALPRRIRFIAKRELFRIPIFGWYLKLARFVPVDRSNRARAIASLHEAARMVQGGISLIAFAEGTRSADRRVHPFKKGPFVLALEAGVPVVPIAVAGSGAVTPKRHIAVQPGPIRVRTGESIDVRRFTDRTELLKQARRRVIEQHVAAGGLGGDLEDAVATSAEGLRQAVEP